MKIISDIRRTNMNKLYNKYGRQWCYKKTSKRINFLRTSKSFHKPSYLLLIKILHGTVWNCYSASKVSISIADSFLNSLRWFTIEKRPILQRIPHLLYMFWLYLNCTIVFEMLCSGQRDLHTSRNLFKYTRL